ncbi:hypothetical protein [Nostoc sp. UHCC 0252]|nr:hypothetical protein [Nostoc sp. UHCC 0252]MEA5601800.1 hypothetical protein [Nostoc sp. UHCC 0252]
MSVQVSIIQPSFRYLERSLFNVSKQLKASAETKILEKSDDYEQIRIN